MASRVQRYRLTHEFVLRDRGDYAAVRQKIELALRAIAESTTGYGNDYLAIEKVSDND